MSEILRIKKLSGPQGDPRVCGAWGLGGGASAVAVVTTPLRCEDHCEYEASLVYTTSYRTARGTRQDHKLKK